MIPVLHLRASAGVAGPERWLLEAAGSLAAEGFAVTAGLLTRRRGGARAPHPLLREAPARGLAALELDDPGRLGGHAAAAARELGRASGAALIHAHDPKADWVALRVARRLRVPALATVHLHTGSTLALRVYRRLDRLLLRRFAAVFAVSAPVARELGTCLRPGRLRVVANGLDVACFSRRAAGEREAAAAELAGSGPGPWIIAVGRLASQKGFDLLIDALARGGGRLASARLALVGEGVERARLERRAAASGLGSRVRFLGDRRDVAGFLAAADLVALPSRREGLPYVALEALALGRPLVAAAAGGLAELIGADEVGWCVPVEDVAALAAALRAALDDPTAATARAERGRLRVESGHGAARMAAQVAGVYRDLLAPSGAR